MIILNPSRKLPALMRIGGCLPVFLLAMGVVQTAALAVTNTSSAIPWSEIGATASANYKGDGLAVTPTGASARLHCVFQRLDGEATPEGLWLISTVTNTMNDRFNVTAMAIGRKGADATFNSLSPEAGISLPGAGEVSICGQTVRLSRPGLTEEYSVSMDGVRQDFIVDQAPLSAQDGEMVLKLAVSGAEVEPAADGARLVLTHSGRKIAYSRLRVTDATGKELPARMEVASVGDDATSLYSWIVSDKDIEELRLLTPAPATAELVIVVNDAEAVYPMRIDPTFSDANWISMGGLPGANGTVSAAVTDNSGNLYIGGDFTVVGNAAANNIAQWDGSSWSALGSGMSGGDGNGPYVYALAVSGSTLYAGGDFTNAGGSAANNIAQWNGSSWSALCSGMNGAVSALVVSGSTLYAGGDFTTAATNAVNYVAQWDGTNWLSLGSGFSGVGNDDLGPYVSALAVSGGTLYAGGDFTMAGGSAASDIAQWDGTNWLSLGSGFSGVGNFGTGPYVSALAVSGSTLYAGGDFKMAGGSAANSIAQWNGSSWSTLGSGVSGGDQYGPVVSALTMSGSTLYAGGDFTTAGGSAANYIAQWDGTNWSALGSGMNISVLALASSGSTLYAGGDFTRTGTNVANYIAQWDGSSWSALGSGMNYDVTALAVSGNTLYAGGDFKTAGTNVVDYIAQWDGSSWSALGSGMNNSVEALAVLGSTLYAGGYFTTAGTNVANYIAQWDGSSWSALSSGIGGNGSSVNALAVSGSTLYVGGVFTTAGGSAANDIAQWNGSSWSALGSGMGGNYPYVFALAVSGSTLYAGGYFTTAGGSTANYIAQWNGSSWSALGSGMNSDVRALAVSGGTLYAGGGFTTAGSGAANSIAQWNGSSWSPLGSGISGVGNIGLGPFVLALAASGDTLYAGGEFATAGGSTANSIAQWDGSSWSALGSGMNGTVEALVVSGSTLYAGGLFTTAGTNASAYAAMANLPVSLVIITTNAAFGFMDGVFGFDVAGPSGADVVIQASTDLQSWIPLQTNLLGSGLLYFSDVRSPTNVQCFYRVQLSP
jgi:hypothetical protein